MPDIGVCSIFSGRVRMVRRKPGSSTTLWIITKKVALAGSNCARCGERCGRLCTVVRRLWEIGDATRDRREERQIQVHYGHYYCARCDRYFSAETSYLGPAKCQYTHRVIDKAVDLVTKRKLSYRRASQVLWDQYVVRVPFGTIQNWVENRQRTAASVRLRRKQVRGSVEA
jgi:hypothetical protein